MAKTRTVTIKYLGIYMDVEGYYSPSEPRTYDYPGSPTEFEVEKVMIESTNIIDLLDEHIEDIERNAIEQIDSGYFDW